MTAYAPLKILAEDAEDLEILAACLQDALVPVSGLNYDQETKCFHMLTNRFCWECEPDQLNGKEFYSRVVSGLVFHHVNSVQKKDLNLHEDHELVNLLTIHNQEEGCLHLVFSGGSEIKLVVDQIRCHLKDLEDPYPTAHKPEHASLED